MSVRFRGALGGGSDSMSVQVLAALLVAHLADHPSVTLGAVFFIAVQSVLSYVLAGAAKLRSSAWRRGAALQSFGRSHAHRPIPLIDRPWAAVAASWLVIGFECGFVLALSSPTRAVGFILLALVFHVANARMFGLGRFAWIWMSTYPAVYFAADFLGGAR